jgi:hypothetical protein
VLPFTGLGLPAGVAVDAAAVYVLAGGNQVVKLPSKSITRHRVTAAWIGPLTLRELRPCCFGCHSGVPRVVAVDAAVIAGENPGVQCPPPPCSCSA